MALAVLVLFSLLSVSLSLTPINEAVKLTALKMYAPDTVLHTAEVSSGDVQADP
jgi:hypothetical protein